MSTRYPPLHGKFAYQHGEFLKLWLEDLFEKSDMKMENGNMGSESSTIAKQIDKIV